MKKKKIFVVEDDESVQEILRLVLEKAGYEIEFSSNGHLIYNDLKSWPDLFLLDKHLAGSDGVDICKYLKSKDQTKKIPVIMLSATPGVETLAREAGADDFMEKPFNSALLIKKVADFLA